MAMKVEKCKGFRDLPPREMQKFRLIEDIFRDTCMRWGYQEVRTPALEYLYLFTSVGTLTPGMLRRVYSFLDWDGWSGERVVLKPDGTIPVARFYIENLKKGPARFFYVTNVFIFEETGKKSREKWQCGVELIGENSVIADGEMITLALDALHKLGLMDVKVILSHAGLIRALLEEMELPSKEKGRIFDQILDGDLETLAYTKPDKPELVQMLSLLLKLKGKSPGLLKNIKVISGNKLPSFKPGLDNFIGVVELLEELDCDYRIDLASGKGFEYYTGIIFHLSIGKEIIGGGGRYDELIPLMGGRDMPAAGFALYVDNLMRIVKEEDTEEPVTKMVSVSITHEMAKEGFEIADILRKAGMTVELTLVGQQTVECGWFIEIKTESPIFIITNLLNGKKSAVNSANDVKTLLGCE
jgi:histidyl-tRNA synthetase